MEESQESSERFEERQPEVFECDICENTFKYSRTLISHMILVHEKQNNYKCDQCNKPFKDIKSHDDHVRIHFQNIYTKKGKQRKCDICDAWLSTCSTLKNHLSVIHGIIEKDTIECDICQASFESSKN